MGYHGISYVSCIYVSLGLDELIKRVFAPFLWSFSSAGVAYMISKKMLHETFPEDILHCWVNGFAQIYSNIQFIYSGHKIVIN